MNLGSGLVQDLVLLGGGLFLLDLRGRLVRVVDQHLLGLLVRGYMGARRFLQPGADVRLARVRGVLARLGRGHERGRVLVDRRILELALLDRRLHRGAVRRGRGRLLGLREIRLVRARGRTESLVLEALYLGIGSAVLSNEL